MSSSLQAVPFGQAQALALVECMLRIRRFEEKCAELYGQQRSHGTPMYHLVNELGPSKIRVNMVIPTFMWGPPVEGYVKSDAKRRGISEEEVIAEITSTMPLGEIPKDDDVANACLFFCSDYSRMVTGETLLVNAGELLR